MVKHIVIAENRVEILVADVRAALETLPDDSVDCVVTSPPYWGLRDYGVAGQIGMEPTLAEHLAAMVDVFRHVRRVLKPTGTVWLNYGDCYATTPNGRSAADTKAAGGDDRTFRDKPFSTVGGALKPKDLAMIPNRLAIALQEDGWWVRSEIIWAKPNPMPESVLDRPATSHEKIFLLTKAERYWWDAVGSRLPAAGSSERRWAENVEAQAGSPQAHGGTKTLKAVGGPRAARIAAGKQSEYTNRRISSLNENWLKAKAANPRDGAWPRGHTRNLRNYEPAPLEVWNIGTRPFKGAHFATFPPELVERAITAGCPTRVCQSCGAPWRIVSRSAFVPQQDVSQERGKRSADQTDASSRWAGSSRGSTDKQVVGLLPVCRCYDAQLAAMPEPRRPRKRAQRAAWPGRIDRCRQSPAAAPSAWPSARAIVLDPFGGAGTTGLVASRMGRNAILIELNESYAQMAAARIAEQWEGPHTKRKRNRQDNQGGLPLFSATQEEAGG